ncbi:unnamed protein product [Schistosoma turkestanicum]|nr:unnamed protein product [Schistosoma turkestanicum]
MLAQSPVHETSLGGHYQHRQNSVTTTTTTAPTPLTTTRPLPSFSSTINQQSLPTTTHQPEEEQNNTDEKSINPQQQQHRPQTTNQSTSSTNQSSNDAEQTLHKIKSPSGIPRLFSLNESLTNRLNNNNHNNNNHSSPITSPNVSSNGKTYTTTNHTTNNHNSVDSNKIFTNHSTSLQQINNILNSTQKNSQPTSTFSLSPTNDVGGGGSSSSQRVSRPRTISNMSTTQPVVNRQDRAMSEYPHKTIDTESDSSSVFSSSGPPRPISSKVGSFQNAKHKPGGGNVQIFNEKVVLNTVTGKCNSLANVKHKPGIFLLKCYISMSCCVCMSVGVLLLLL